MTSRASSTHGARRHFPTDCSASKRAAPTAPLFSFDPVIIMTPWAVGMPLIPAGSALILTDQWAAVSDDAIWLAKTPPSRLSGYQVIAALSWTKEESFDAIRACCSELRFLGAICCSSFKRASRSCSAFSLALAASEFARAASTCANAIASLAFSSFRSISPALHLLLLPRH